MQYKAKHSARRLHLGIFMKYASLVIFLALCGMGLTTPAQATKAENLPVAVGKPPQTQIMQYDVYAGGIHAVKAQMEVTYQSNDRYDMKIGAATIGFLEKLVPWRGTFETHGWRGKEMDQPEIHRSVATWRGDEDLTEYHYGKDGTLNKLTIVEASEDKSPKIDPELVKGTTDVLTGMLEVMQHIQKDGK